MPADAVELPEPFERALDCHRTLIGADIAKNLAGLYERGKDRLSDVLRAMIEEGQAVLAVDYNRALDLAAVLEAGLERPVRALRCNHHPPPLAGRRLWGWNRPAVPRSARRGP